MYHGNLAAALAHLSVLRSSRRRLYWNLRASNMDITRYGRVIRWNARLSAHPRYCYRQLERRVAIPLCSRIKRATDGGRTQRYRHREIPTRSGDARYIACRVQYWTERPRRHSCSPCRSDERSFDFSCCDESATSTPGNSSRCRYRTFAIAAKCHCGWSSLRCRKAISSS